MDPNWTRLERRLKNGRTYDIADDSIDKLVSIIMSLVYMHSFLIYSLKLKKK